MTDSTAEAVPPPGPVRDVYDMLTGDEDARVCKDIPDASCREQPRNFLLQLGSLSLTKTGDGFADAKLVLPWLLSGLGAPAYLTGLLVPVRESLSLLPQLVVAAAIRRLAVRKWAWVAGSGGQALALVGMALAAFTLIGAAAGWTIVGLLAVFSLSRGVCSVANKDVLGKTVSKTRRGRLSGYAATVSGIAVGALGLFLILGTEARSTAFLGGLLLVAAGLWILAAALYAALAEEAGATEGGGNALAEAVKQIRLLRTDPPFRDFVLTRMLLLSTALAAPFYVALAQETAETGLSGLGWLVVASGLAGAVSASLWGGLADRSSRRVLIYAAGIAGVLGLAVAALRLAAPGWTANPFFFAVVIFVLAGAHAGVRLGRKTYLVDLATADTRAAYVAVSNTIIGVTLLGGGLFGVLAEYVGPLTVIALLATLSLAGAAMAWRLREAE